MPTQHFRLAVSTASMFLLSGSIVAAGDVCPNPDHLCQNTGTPGCSDADCCNAVCAVDGFCCSIAWDGICVNEALSLCSSKGPFMPCGNCSGPDLNGDLPYIFGVVNSTDCESASAVDPSATTGLGSGTALTVCLPPGESWLFVAPNTFLGFPCTQGNNAYFLEVKCSGEQCSSGAH